MDFFEAQARARQRTSRLILFFALAVAGMIAAGYFAAIFLLHHAGGHEAAQALLGRLDPHADSIVLWQPDVLGVVAAGTLFVVGAGSLFKWLQFSGGGGAVAESVGGRRVDPHTTEFKERRLLNVVEEMAIASGVPMPAVYVLDDEPAINAFAAGLTTKDAVVAVTRGTLEKLTREELQGVVGHEFSHILNGDMRLNLRLAATIFGILVIGLAGRGLLWGLRHARVRTDRDKNGGGLVLILIGVGLALLIIGYVGYFFGRLIQAAVSRQREFLADASAVQFTRNPAGLGGALKKIGGYALGSSMQSSKSAAIGHFFFAQGFRSHFGGLWATHPPLGERIRAIEPRFDGKFFDPPEVVDVGRQSFVSAGLAPARPAPPVLAPAAALAGLAAAGSLPPAAIDAAHDLLESTPDRLRLAAQTTGEARLLVCGLLLADDPAVRAGQRNIVGAHYGGESLRQLDQLESSLQRLRPEHKLPLLQIALPALRSLPAPALGTFLGTLDALVHADEHVSAFEFALQKTIARALALGRPGGEVVQIHSFNAVTAELSAVLSLLARAATAEPERAAQSFAAGAAQLPLVAAQLQFLPESTATLAQLDGALDKLATASPAIKQRTLVAAAHTVTADGRLLVAEGELLRAIAAALDVPVPPLGAVAA
ncbi:MAG: M48 family metallopeptidase [Opitutaceae bacterium]|nr:M48 family metallopeptidase [Opitutaceae bacterium]